MKFLNGMVGRNPNRPPIIGPLRYTTFMVVGWAVV
jgi:hypothetical protein